LRLELVNSPTSTPVGAENLRPGGADLLVRSSDVNGVIVIVQAGR
jgi:hypothetical protein